MTRLMNAWENRVERMFCWLERVLGIKQAPIANLQETLDCCQHHKH